MTTSARDCARPWQYPGGLESFEVTEIPRDVPDAPGGNGSGNGGGAQVPAGYAALLLRAQSKAPASRRDAAARRDWRAVRAVLPGSRPPSVPDNAASTVGAPAWREKPATALTVLGSRHGGQRGLLASWGDPG